jgi:hypothetical protein
MSLASADLRCSMACQRRSLPSSSTHDLKGITGAVKAWAVSRAASIETRFDLLRCHRPTPALCETALRDVTAQRPQAWASHATRPPAKKRHLASTDVGKAIQHQLGRQN